MKKSYLLAVVGGLGLAFASCAFAAGEVRAIPETYLTMSVGSSGGGWYIMGAGMNEAWENGIQNLKMTLVPGGGGSNPTLVNKGDRVQVGFTYMSNAAACVAGTGAYKDKGAHTNVVALASLNVKQYLNVNSLKSASFSSFDEIAEKKPKLKINVGPRGSGSEGMINCVLGLYGVTYDDIKSWGGSVQYNSTDTSFSALKDGQIDVAANTSVLGLPSLIETAAARELNFLAIGEKQGAELPKYGFSYEPIPAGTYPGQNEPVPAAVDKVIIVINKDVSDDVAYDLAKVLCESKEKLEGVHGSFKDFDPAAAAITGIPVHPGAIAYYKDAGYIK